jgi:hypothetical protein
VIARRPAGAGAAFLALAGLLAPGCAGEGQDDGGPCLGAKCDVPDGGDEEQCVLRRQDAFNDNQLAFTEYSLRWSCQDTAGINGIDRGQEYCEYFTIVQLPPADSEAPAPEPAVLGRLIRIENDDPDDPNAESFDQTPIGVELTAYQIGELDADPGAVIAQCVFSSWNVDFEEDPPSCYDADGCPEVLGVPVEPENFRMKFDANSADAAQALTEDCFAAEESGNLDNSEDPLHDDFYRGCMINSEINETSYRKSDSTICPAINRLAECGCEPAAGNLAELVSPWERRGFPLGTWSSPAALPSGCRYVELGDGSQTVVSCDLTADEILSYSSDPKALCREKYAPNVVVHVPLDPTAVSCSPSLSASPYRDSCPDPAWLLAD